MKKYIKFLMTGGLLIVSRGCKKNLDLVKQMLSRTDVLIVNLEEAKKITGKDMDGKSLIKELANLGAKEVVITNSGEGAWAGDANGVWHMASFPVEVMSKTGAGDAFSSGYLAARFYKQNIDTSLSWGIANSCAAISSLGSEKNLLNKKEIIKMISKFSSVKPVLSS